jgi:uncharacterized protein VirK/YbjX
MNQTILSYLRDFFFFLHKNLKTSVIKMMPQVLPQYTQHFRQLSKSVFLVSFLSYRQSAACYIQRTFCFRQFDATSAIDAVNYGIAE